MIEGATQVEKSHMETVQERQTLLESEDGW